MGTTRSRIYRDGELIAADVDPDRFLDALGDPATVVWVGICDPSSEDLPRIASQLGLHELAVEDALEPHQRPKLDHYADHLFLTCHSTRVDLEDARLDVTEVDVFIGDRWMITVHHESFDLVPVEDRWDRSPQLASHGVSFLLYGLLDVVIDGYFEAIEAFDAYYEDISEEIFSDRPLSPDQQLEWFQMRKALFKLHRLSVPMREAVSSLMRREHEAVSEALYPYFQDVYDHILRVTESTDALRDLVSTIVETNLSLRDYRQNQVMKKVTSWAAIIAVPTLITGYYGMNVRYPGFASYWGAWFSAALMVSISLGLYLQFKRNDWL